MTATVFNLTDEAINVANGDQWVAPAGAGA